jgi:hypothetical protein
MIGARAIEPVPECEVRGGGLPIVFEVRTGAANLGLPSRECFRAIGPHRTGPSPTRQTLASAHTGMSPDHEPTPTKHGTDAHSNYPLTAHRGNRARGPLEGSTTCLTPLPCERATMVVIKSRVFIRSPLIGPGLRGSSHHDHPDGRHTNSPKVAPPKKWPTYPNILGQRDASPCVDRRCWLKQT